jgi:hypothetical protein
MGRGAQHEELDWSVVTDALQRGDGAAIARLEATMVNLADQVGRLTGAVDENNKQLGRLSVLEERNATTAQALDRAFEAIKGVKDDATALKTKVEAKHAHYDKYIWMAVGFITCVSVAWTVVGYSVNQSIQRTAEKIGRYDLHLAQDKILVTDDVRAIIRDNSDNRTPRRAVPSDIEGSSGG